MKTISSFKALEKFGRTRLSDNFFMRDFLYSEISNFYGIPNLPDNPARAIEAGQHLCRELIEPLNASNRPTKAVIDGGSVQMSTSGRSKPNPTRQV